VAGPCFNDRMDYELAKELKDAGFPQRDASYYWTDGTLPSSYRHAAVLDESKYVEAPSYAAPTLSELVKACGENFRSLDLTLLPSSVWHCTGVNASATHVHWTFHGTTPEAAVARLWMGLKSPTENADA